MLHGTDVKKWFLILVLIIQYCITVLATFLGYINGNEYLIYTRRGGGDPENHTKDDNAYNKHE